MTIEELDNKKIMLSDGNKKTVYRVSCANCGKEIWRRKSSVESYKYFICSNKCQRQYKREGEICQCKTCGKRIYKSPAELKRNNGNCFCSRRCATIFNNTKYKSGNNHPNYIDGSYGQARNLVKNSEWFCVDCGEDRKFLLVVHHKDGNRKNNSKRNLEVVCMNHHAIRHLKQDGNGG